eukprot:CAMPEP_0175772592 /NCGR_PEP_ID=MMETSP0097-20121207/72632_1 /TAXON_ID=311494 /ORGANISM="Alexandrium monilatum, Strain CCMP3105" /LENGTH=271 /DNA_ID=CAMNT_0017082957 /DNA_START=1 /DNA_END=813 /DNA_ORIENTATION=+
MVKSYNPDKGFGFIACEDTYKQYKCDVFLHKQQAEEAQGLQVGDAVKFLVEVNAKGKPQARKVARVITEAAPQDKQSAQIQDAWDQFEADKAPQTSEVDPWALAEESGALAQASPDDPWAASAAAPAGQGASEEEEEAAAWAEYRAALAAEEEEEEVHDAAPTEDEQAVPVEADADQLARRLGFSPIFVRGAEESRRQRDQLQEEMLDVSSMSQKEYGEKANQLSRLVEIVRIYDALLSVADQLGEMEELSRGSGEMAEVARQEALALEAE